jgi:hypothetical protein
LLFKENALIKEVLVLFFRDILDFYLIALKFFSQSRECSEVVMTSDSEPLTYTCRVEIRFRSDVA